MFRDAGDHVNALCELYRVTRPSVAQLETLLAMAADGTGAQRGTSTRSSTHRITRRSRATTPRVY